MNILVVDDSAVMRRIHKNTLLEHNFPEQHILEAEDGEKALKIAKETDAKTGWFSVCKNNS